MAHKNKMIQKYMGWNITKKYENVGMWNRLGNFTRF